MEVIVQDEQRIHSAMNKFLDGRALPANLVPKTIERSWIRLRNAGIEPGHRAKFEAERELNPDACRYEAGTLIDAAVPAMKNLSRSLGSPNWAVLCIDRNGVIVSSILDRSCALGGLTRSLQTGRTVRESQVGTNAPACVLEDQKPIVVQGAQHFLQDLRDYRCVASPIFGPDGEIVGALDVTGLGVEIHPWLIGQVVHSARQIENLLLRQIEGARLVGLHHMREFLGTAAEGVLAIDDHGRVLAGNRAACEMLESDVRSIKGMPVNQLLDRFDPDFPEQADHEAMMASVSGSMLYVRRYARPVRSRAPSSARIAKPVCPAGIVSDPGLSLLTEKATKAYARSLPVLVLGETGTGKEVLARAVHEAAKPGRPFVAINCSAVPESLIESEIFGHVEGAFTGARKGGAPGLLEQASGGTLFLDEIGDAPLPLQAKLLRVLQEGTVRRLGGQREIQVDLSVVSATHRDIAKMIAEGAFREDLYYRLNGMSLTLPPLRDRTNLLELVDEFMVRFSARGEHPQLTEDARKALLGYSWPGNIRQLQQVIRAAVALADDVGAIGLDDISQHISLGLSPPSSEAIDAGATLSDAQTELIEKTLESLDFNVAKTARALNISRTTIYNRLRKSSDKRTH